ncbi:hypothetical protein QQ045_028450 [Rhodiola kirilowii]
MYETRAHGESYTNDVFIAGVKIFIESAVSKGYLASDNTIRCPCSKCKNWRFINIRMMEEHLYKYGFTPDYVNWTLHGKDLLEIEYENTSATILDPSTYEQINDFGEDIWSHAASPYMDTDFDSHPDIPELSNYGEHRAGNFEANRFFNLLHSSSEPSYKGYTTETELSINMKMLATKANYGLSKGAFNAVCGTMKNLIGGRIKSRILSNSPKNL